MLVMGEAAQREVVLVEEFPAPGTSTLMWRFRFRSVRGSRDGQSRDGAAGDQGAFLLF